jgi:hypothetical protein
VRFPAIYLRLYPEIVLLAIALCVRRVAYSR